MTAKAYVKIHSTLVQILMKPNESAPQRVMYVGALIPVYRKTHEQHYICFYPLFVSFITPPKSMLGAAWECC